jgi:oxygen-independent coproporphyrinogen-3 oxidase
MSDPPGIYIHVPFCRTKCAYCDFYSVDLLSAGKLRGLSSSDRTAEHRVAERYFGALESEVSMRAETLPAPADSLYVGGGTPSAVEPGFVSSIPGMISRAAGLEEGAEVTIEVNPDDLTPGALESYLAGGFNRLSIGVQSFDDSLLSFLGRRHDAAGAAEALEAARSSGFKGVGIDMIFGIAGQTLEGSRKDIERALRFDPDHISCYQLTVESDTPLGERMRAGEDVTPGEEIQREMFLEISRILTGSGYIHYEVSNFARGESNRSRHNMRYWLRRPYLGLGPSAHSFDGRIRRWNHRSLDRYLRAVEAGENPAGGEERLSAGQVRAERLMLGFRTQLGVDLDLLKGYPGWEGTLEEILELSLVRVEGDRVIPTVEGYLVADQLPLLFM